MPRGGGRHHHHHRGGPHGHGWRGGRGRGWGRPIVGGPFWGPPPPGPPPPRRGGPILGAAVLGAAVVGGAVAADEAARHRQQEQQEQQQREIEEARREELRRQARLQIEEEKRQIDAAKAASAKEESERLAREQAKLEQQQKQIEKQMAQLNMMKQQQQQQQSQNSQQSSANYDYYGAINNINQNANNSSQSITNEAEGQPGANPNSAVTNAYPQQSSQQQPPFNPNYSYYPQQVPQQVQQQPQQQGQTQGYYQYQQYPQPQVQPQQGAQSQIPQNYQNYGNYNYPVPQQQQPQQSQQVQQSQSPKQAQPGQQVSPPAQIVSGYQAPPAYAPGAQNENSGEISYPKLSKPSTSPKAVNKSSLQSQVVQPGNNGQSGSNGSNASNPPPPSYDDHVAARGSVASNVGGNRSGSVVGSSQGQQRQETEPGQVSFIKPPEGPEDDDEKSMELGNTDDGNFEGPMGEIRSRQPLDNPRPTLTGLENYNDTMALEDAKELRKAMKGWGTKEHPIIKIAGTRNAEQRQQILQAFINVDSVLYNDNKQRDLLKDFKSELSGHLKEIIMSLFMTPAEYDQKLIEDALSGAGYNKTILIEVLCTRNNEQLKQMQNVWDKKFKQTLKERVHKETNKWFAVGNFQTLMDSILDCQRDESKEVNKILAKQDAELLNRVVTQDKKKEAKQKFVEIFCNRSWRHLRQLSNDFNEISKKYTLVAAIATTFGEGETSNAMRVILEFSMQPYDFWAKRIKGAMTGMGTNDKLLKRVIISRCEIDLYSVAEVFGQRYGNGKTLGKWIKDDTSGFYKEILLYLTNYHS